MTFFPAGPFCSCLLYAPPPPLGYFLAIRIQLLSLPVISVPAFFPGHFVYSCFLSSAFSSLLIPPPTLTHSPISVSQFLILTFSQTRSQQPHWEETDLIWKGGKKCFPIKMDDLLSVTRCFSVRDYLNLNLLDHQSHRTNGFSWLLFLWVIIFMGYSSWVFKSHNTEF